MANRRRSNLAEQLSELSNPRPASFHPDEEFLGDGTAAKVCDFAYEEGSDHVQLPSAPSVMLARARRGIEIDGPKYAGKVVSRKELEGGSDSDSEASSDLSGLEGEEERLQAILEHRLENDHMISDEDRGSAELSDEDEQDRDEVCIDDDDMMSDGERGLGEADSAEEADEGEEEEGIQGSGQERGQEEATVSLFAVSNDVEKGKAAREQIRLLDKLLELRIKFQGILVHSNRLPSPENMPLFLEEGGPSLKEALNQTHRNIQKLLWALLGLQEDFLNEVDGANGSSNSTTRQRDGSDDDEDVPSEEEEEEDEELKREKDSLSNLPTRSRKRKHSSESEQDSQEKVERLHSRLRPYRNSIISKWNDKTRLASGKITSKAYIEVDRSILSQIDHVMADKERLIKRTQLRRSVYHILGENEDKEDEETSDPSSQRDAHLRDYNDDIFDDDDFYHQLLKELIERKTSYSESADPIEMGRQWLQLQKMRTKAKKNVDTKASKGRKLRFNVHPKLVNFMAPIDGGKFSDASKNDLFSSLFGARYMRRT